MVERDAERAGLGNQSARRALELLLALMQAEQPLGLMDLSVRLQLDKSTCARQLALLESMSLISRVEASRKYRVGPGMIAAASAMLRQLDLREIARPHLLLLRDESGETATLHLRVNDERVCIDGIESTAGLRRVVPIGEVTPISVGASGAVMLAHLSDREIDVVAKRRSCGRNARALLARNVETARRDGFVTDVRDAEGVVVVSAAVDAATLGLAAISISGPSQRWTIERARNFGPRLREAAAAIEHQISR